MEKQGYVEKVCERCKSVFYVRRGEAIWKEKHNKPVKYCSIQCSNRAKVNIKFEDTDLVKIKEYGNYVLFVHSNSGFRECFHKTELIKKYGGY